MELFFLEKKLIDKIYIDNTKEALFIYKKLFYYFFTYDLSNDCPIRSIKNHLILLNQSLYDKFHNNVVCEYRMYKKRNIFTLSFEKSISIDKLYNLGKEMLIYYSNSTVEKCICTKNPVIKEALIYIYEHINEDLSLEKVSSKVHMSKSHFSSLFAQCTGCTFSNYVNKIRIEKSKLILKTTKKPISDIAIECGFNSQSYFCSAFKKFTNMTPLEYRNKL